MDSERKTQSGGDCRPPRRCSSRPAGAPAPAANRAPAPSATPTQPTPTSHATSTRTAPTSSTHAQQHTSPTTTPRPTTTRATSPSRTAASPARTSATPPHTLAATPRPAKPRPTNTPRNGAIVLDPNGVAGKAPKRYTRSSTQNNGRRPVTRSLTKSQVKRNRGRSYPETSAGGLVLRNMRRAYNPRTNRVYLSAVKVALIGRTDRRGRLLWSLPKGHIEDYETVPMTAVREVREETGIEGEVIKHLGTIDYWFLSDGKRIHKTVHHYLLRFVGGELSNADAEISEVKWVSMKDLPAHLSYADERKLARRATSVVAAWIRSEYGSGDGTDETIQIEGEFPDDDILGDDLDEADLLEPAHSGQYAGDGQPAHGNQQQYRGRTQGDRAESDRSTGDRAQGRRAHNGRHSRNGGQNSGQRRGDQHNRPRPTTGATGAAGATAVARTNDTPDTPDTNETNGATGTPNANGANGTNGAPRKKRRRGHRGRGGRSHRPSASTGNQATNTTPRTPNTGTPPPGNPHSVPNTPAHE